MKHAIIGKKVGMTQIFDEAGKVVPVTVIEAGPCTVTAKATAEKEGYDAVQLGFQDVAEKKLSKPEKGHLAKAGVGYKYITHTILFQQFGTLPKPFLTRPLHWVNKLPPWLLIPPSSGLRVTSRLPEDLTPQAPLAQAL